jgi:ABC-type phosphate transport system auxiliary subunit
VIQFLGITTSDSIRGVLGVDEEEVPDQVMNDVNLAEQLEIDIESWLADPITTVVTEGNAGGATDTQLKRLKLLKLHAQFRGAILIFSHLRSGTAQETSDGQNTLKRRAQDLERLLPELEQMAAKYQVLLMDLDGMTPAGAPTLAGKATPAYDPVTNETS